jgi:hypothetical protein
MKHFLPKAPDRSAELVELSFEMKRTDLVDEMEAEPLVLAEVGSATECDDGDVDEIPAEKQEDLVEVEVDCDVGVEDHTDDYDATDTVAEADLVRDGMTMEEHSGSEAGRHTDGQDSMNQHSLCVDVGASMPAAFDPSCLVAEDQNIPAEGLSEMAVHNALGTVDVHAKVAPFEYDDLREDVGLEDPTGLAGNDYMEEVLMMAFVGSNDDVEVND